MLDNGDDGSVACGIMCCFTGKVEEVKNTRIFARLGERGHQVIIYQMSVNAPQDLAMVLPIARFRLPQGHGMIRPELHVDRQSMRGTFDNGDVVVKVCAA